MTNSGRTSATGNGIPGPVRELLIRESVLAMGRTAPNPAVAAVVRARRGEAERFFSAGTEPAGRRHAEIAALDAAAAAGFEPLEIFVTLEPCSTHGRTPPCTDRIISHRTLERITFLTDDPHLQHAGERTLTDAGRKVTRERGEAEIPRAFLGGFLARSGGSSPRFHVKSAVTVDGMIGEKGDRLAISGPMACLFTMILRAKVDAVLVGPGTVRADRPRLDVRPRERSVGSELGKARGKDVFLDALLDHWEELVLQLNDPQYQPDRVFLLGSDFPGSTDWLSEQKQVAEESGRAPVFAVIVGCEEAWKKRIEIAGVLPSLHDRAFSGQLRNFCASRKYNEVLLEPGAGMLAAFACGAGDRFYELRSTNVRASGEGILFGTPAGEESAVVSMGADTLTLRCFL